MPGGVLQIHFSLFSPRNGRKMSKGVRLVWTGFCKELASNQAQALLIWWRRDLGLGASKNRRICNHYVFKVVSQNLAYWQRVTRVVTRVSGGTAERRTGPGAERLPVCGDVARLVHGRGDALLRVEVVTRVDVLRLERFVNPQKNVGVCWVCSLSLWTSSLFDPETRAAEERRSCLGWKSCYCRAADCMDSGSRSFISCFPSPSHSEKRSFPKPGIFFRVLFIWRNKSIY